jgi:hypothetical protein
MKRCPKCSSQYGDDSKLCRICGAILESVAEEPPQTGDLLPHEGDYRQEMISSQQQTSDLLPHENDHEQETALSQGPSWKCPHCGESVPGGFEVCWNCGTNQDGASDPGFAKEPDSDPWKEEPDSDSGEEERDSAPWTPEEEPAAAKPMDRQCPRCGSSKIIPKTTILDIGSSTGDLRVVVYAHPDALIFKDHLCERLTADICGDCGHAELKVENPKELYEHYLRSRAEQERE